MTSDSHTILIASDHAGFELKEALEAELKSLGYEVDDLGPASEASTDRGVTAVRGTITTWPAKL